MSDVSTLATPGTIVDAGRLVTPGGPQGPTGLVGPSGPQGVPGITTLADSAQNGLLRQTTGLVTDFVDGTNNYQDLSSAISLVRLRSYNAIGNPSFEVDQRLAGMANITNGTFIADRWVFSRAGGAMQFTGTIAGMGPPGAIVPGTNFSITTKHIRFSVAAQQATLGATDYCMIHQTVDGSMFRELFGDTHSVSILARSNYPNMKFTLTIRDFNNSTVTKSLCKLCTVGPNALAWTLITLPNLPIWPSGTFNTVPGSAGYLFGFCMAAGSTYMAPQEGVWIDGNLIGAPGMHNFAGFAVGTYLDIAFVQHEPGPKCTTLIDVPFLDNYNDCLQYFHKTYSYPVKPGTVTSDGAVNCSAVPNQDPAQYLPFKRKLIKTPTVIFYSNNTGAPNAVRDNYAAIDRGVSAVIGHNQDHAGYPLLTSHRAGETLYAYHFVADTVL